MQGGKKMKIAIIIKLFSPLSSLFPFAHSLSVVMVLWLGQTEQLNYTFMCVCVFAIDICANVCMCVCFVHENANGK